MSIQHQIVRTSKRVASEMQFHSLADLFPMMTDEELKGLTADIKEHGQLEKIVTLDGEVLDGRNRYRACQALGIEPKCIEWSGVGSAQAFVVSHNLHRRHLSIAQRAMIAASLATLKKGQRADLNRKNSDHVASATSSLSAKEAAKLMGISRDAISDARLILKEGTPEEKVAVEAGEIGLQTVANKIRAKVPAEERLKKNPDIHKARANSYRANSKIWQQLRAALDNLTSLPSVQDVVRIARAHDRGSTTEAKLLTALQWLTEFSDAWTSPDTQASSGRKDKSARKAAKAAAAQGAEGGEAEEGRPLREAGGVVGRGNGGWREDHADAGDGSRAA